MPGYLRDEDIAIIGMAGRFPEADHLEEFWSNLITGRESVRPFPESRVQELSRMVGFTPAIRFARSGYLNQTLQFEPELFSISQEECKIIDPQQRLLLELVEEAILDAGYSPESLANRYVGVFIADNENKYTELAEMESPMLFVNKLAATNAGRVSYTYNFHGPAMTIGSACSSSLVALHYACQSLKLHEADFAVAGGVNISLLPLTAEMVAGFPILSPDQQVRTFDRTANGTVSGEGGGVVLLKRAKKALEDGDSIHAIIKGSAINNDGKWSNGITAPSERGQAEVIARAVEAAGIDPQTISYVEAHGTGTSIGDPIEVAGLSSALRKYNMPPQSVPLGALKTNIGHLDSASGIAGVIKTVLALQHRQIPPSINFAEPNPLIDFVNSPVYVNSGLTPWEVQGVRRAGVTSLSFVGTNAHLILEEAPRRSERQTEEKEHRNLITLSARTPNSLTGMARQLVRYLITHPKESIDEIAYTLNCGRRSLPYKFVTTVKSAEELRQQVEEFLRSPGTGKNDPPDGGEQAVTFKAPKGRSLTSTFIVPDLPDAAFAAERSDVSRSYNPFADTEPMTEEEFSEEALYASYSGEIAASLTETERQDRRIRYFLHTYTIAQLLQRYGIKPKVYVGFGLGELVVDCIRGDRTFAETVSLIIRYDKGRVEMPAERFDKGVGNILKLGVTRFFLVAAGSEFLNRFRQRLEQEAVTLVNLEQRAVTFHRTLMEMMQNGFEPDWEQVYQGRGLQRLKLPGYVFDRQSYYLTTGKFSRQPNQNPVTLPAKVSPGNENPDALQNRLAAMFRGVYVGEGFALTDSIQDIDVDSVGMMQFTALIKKEFGVEVPIKLFFSEMTVGQIFQQIAALLASTGSAEIVIERQPDQAHYPVSSAQRRQYILHQIEPDGLAYNLPGVLVVNGQLEPEQLEEGFRALIRHHEILRTSFTMIDGQPVQIVHPDADFHVMRGECTEANLRQTLREFVKPFDLDQAPLFRVGLYTCGGRHFLIYDMHHIISDGTSTWILFRDFLQVYAGIPLPAQRIQYRDFAVWQSAMLATDRYRRMEAYWLERFAGEIPVLNLPTDYPRPAIMDYRGTEYRMRVNPDLVQKVHRFTQDHGVTLYMFLLTAYNVLLAKYTGQDDFVVGSPISGRTHADVQNLIGMFVNTLAMRNQPAREKTLISFLKEVKENALMAFDNQEYQFETLVNKLNLERDLSRNPLFDTMFVLQNTARPSFNANELAFAPYPLDKQVSQFDISLHVNEMAGEMSMTWEYSTRLFTAGAIERFADHMLKVMAGIIENPAGRIAELELMTPAERDQLMRSFNSTQALYPAGTVVDLFMAQVERTPHAPAVQCGGETLTYRELNHRANQVAHLLRRHGVGADQLVGILMERSTAMTVGLLAVWKAGGAYLPMNPTDPADRLEFMLQESDVAVLLTQSKFTDRLSTGTQSTAQLTFGMQDKPRDPVSVDTSDRPQDRLFFAGNVLRLDDPEIYQAEAAEGMRPRPHDLAYMIYTSGSTGKPKGVMIEHRSVVNRLNWMQKQYPLTPADTILQKTPYTFDVSVWELFWWMTVGAKVALLDPGAEKEPGEIVTAVERYRVTTLHFVPSMLTAFLEYCETGAQLNRLMTLKRVFASGEALNPGQVEKFNYLLHRTLKAQLINLYGPTEATVDVTYYDCPVQGSVRVVPIGKPIDNTQIYILDAAQRLQPVGIAGELCIAGVGLSRGYRKRPELTAEKFIPNPFSPGEKMYRTGDLARWLPDGNIEFLGRIDHQVKIRGYRIELGEIENLLAEHPDVHSAVVIDRTDAGGTKYLCAYLVFHRELTVGELRDYLSRELPEYMLPAHFVSLPEIPLNSSGKVDRKALPIPDGSVKRDTEYVAPQSDIEIRLAAIVSELMGVEKVGIDDKFFEIGGDSIKIITFSKLVNEEFQAQLKVQDLFKYYTVRRLAEHLYSRNATEEVKEKRKFKY